MTIETVTFASPPSPVQDLAARAAAPAAGPGHDHHRYLSASPALRPSLSLILTADGGHASTGALPMTTEIVSC